jgi:hypothetical protein
VVGRGREEEDEEGKVRWKWKWRRIYRDTATVIVRYGREQFYFGRPDPRSRFVLPNGDWLGPGFPGRLAVAALSPPWFVFGFWTGIVRSRYSSSCVTPDESNCRRQFIWRG